MAFFLLLDFFNALSWKHSQSEQYCLYLGLFSQKLLIMSN